MKILFVVENYYPHIGGVEAVFRNLAEGLAALGNDVIIVTHRLKGTRKEEVLNGVNIHRISCLGSRYLFTFLSIPAALKYGRDADIIHTTTFNGAPPAWIAAKILGKPSVITVHEVWVGMWDKLGDMGFFARKMHDLLERMIYLLHFDEYAAVSESTKKQLLAVGIPKEKVEVVYNALDYEHFKADKDGRDTIRKKHGLKGFVFLTYGRPGISKGIEYAIKAASIVKKNMPGSRMMLILSKDPAYKKQYAKIVGQIRDLGLEEYIALLPPVAWKELPNYIKAADCVVVPSLAEGFGYTAAEASALDVPVVATNTTSLPEVVSGKHLFVQVKDAEAIAEAVVKISKGKYETTKKKTFTLKNNIEGYLRIYKGLLKQKH
jgi:D-inositol-3-phosphate glycosyltransferase